MNESPETWYPLQFEPVYKDYLWGGRRLVERYGRRAPAGPVAESWEVSAHPDGMSRVTNGPWAGRTLADLSAEHGAALLGGRVGDGPFPLLIKLIDAADRLSVQVHPNDETAARFGGEAKTEMWHLLEADPEAGVYAGLEPGVTPDRLRTAVQAGAFDAVLQRHPVTAGDAVFIPGGRVHAIDRGCLILEVQQSSNTTYRLYDWGRVDAAGRSRELHVDQAIQVIRWDDAGHPVVAPKQLPGSRGGKRWELYESAYFRMERWRLTDPCREPAAPESFRVLFQAEGSTRLNWGGESLVLPAGASCLIPAAHPAFDLEPLDPGTLVQVTVPGP